MEINNVQITGKLEALAALDSLNVQPDMKKPERDKEATKRKRKNYNMETNSGKTAVERILLNCTETLT